jgi:hypothetical protein
MSKSKQWLLDEISTSFVPAPHGSRNTAEIANSRGGTTLTPDRFAAVIVATLKIADDGGMSMQAQIAVLEKIIEAMRKSLT